MEQAIKRARKKRARNKFFRENSKKIALITILLVTVSVSVSAAAVIRGQEEKKEAKQIPIIKIDLPKQEQRETEPEKQIIYEYPFNTMSADWSSEDIEGFKSYEIPQEYEKYGGYLPEIVQVYLYCLCSQSGVDYATALGVIEVESSYHWDAVSGYGAKGYMQVYQEAHKDRIKRLEISDIMNPYQNIRAGVDYLAELVDKYNGNYEKVLTSYRWGVTGAYVDYYSKDQTSCEYTEMVMAAAERIRNQIEGEK